MKVPQTTLGKIGWGLAPFVVGGAVIFAVLQLEIWDHMTNLPDDYVRSSVNDFVIYHHESDKDRAIKVVEGGRLFLNRIQKRFGSKLGDLSLPSQKVTLSLFRNHNEFREFASKSLHQDLAFNGGYFDVFKNEIALVLSDMGGAKPIEGFRHELAHLVLARGSGRYATTMPPWLNEGLASYLETIHSDDSDTQPPVPAVFCKLQVHKAPVPPMRPIVEANSGAFMRAGNIVYYAYSALLVRFLAKFKAARFWPYAKGLLSGKGGETFDDFTEAFGTQEQLQPQWQRFIRTVCQ